MWSLSCDSNRPLWVSLLVNLAAHQLQHLAIIRRDSRASAQGSFVRTTRERLFQSYSGHARGVHVSFLGMSAQIFCDHVDCLAKISSVLQTNKRRPDSRRNQKRRTGVNSSQ